MPLSRRQFVVSRSASLESSVDRPAEVSRCAPPALSNTQDDLARFLDVARQLA